MEKAASFWDIYKSYYFSKSKMIMLIAVIAVWVVLSLVQGLLFDERLPVWSLVPSLLLLVELLYVINCYRKYKSHN